MIRAFITPLTRFPIAVALIVSIAAFAPHTDISTVLCQFTGEYIDRCIPNDMLVNTYQGMLICVVFAYLTHEGATPADMHTPWYIMRSPAVVITVFTAVYIALWVAALITHTPSAYAHLSGAILTLLLVAPYMCREARADQIKAYIIRFTTHIIYALIGIIVIISTYLYAIGIPITDHIRTPYDLSSYLNIWFIWLLPYLLLMSIPQDITVVTPQRTSSRILRRTVLLPITGLLIFGVPVLALLHKNMPANIIWLPMFQFLFTYLFLQEPANQQTRHVRIIVFTYLFIPLLAFGIYGLSVTDAHQPLSQNGYIILAWVTCTGAIIICKQQWPALRLSMYTHALALYINSLWDIIS